MGYRPLSPSDACPRRNGPPWMELGTRASRQPCCRIVCPSEGKARLPHPYLSSALSPHACLLMMALGPATWRQPFGRKPQSVKDRAGRLPRRWCSVPHRRRSASAGQGKQIRLPHSLLAMRRSLMLQNWPRSKARRAPARPTHTVSEAVAFPWRSGMRRGGTFGAPAGVGPALPAAALNAQLC